MQVFWLTASLLVPLTRPGTGAELPVATRPSRAPIARLSTAALAQRIRKQASVPIPKRIASWSALFRGTPYWTPSADSPPTVGLDLKQVDCETFVEQVMALAVSRRRSEVEPTLARIRFDRGIARPDHRHFTVVKGWLAKNEQSGLLKDITRKIGGRATRTLHKRLTPTPKWRTWYRDRFRILGPRAPHGTARIDYIPLTRAHWLHKRIPSGTVVHVVSAPHPRSPYLVTHVGFAIHTRYGTVFRHASRSPHRRQVEDRHFQSYLYYVGRIPAGPEMRTAVGIHLSEVTAP